MLDLETTVRLAEEVVAERGADFNYNPSGQGLCVYVPLSDSRAPRLSSGLSSVKIDRYAEGADVTGCIVGSIIERAGLMTNEIATAAMFAAALVNDGRLDASPAATEFLSDLQRLQDRGTPWGRTLTEAKSRLGHHSA